MTHPEQTNVTTHSEGAATPPSDLASRLALLVFVAALYAVACAIPALRVEARRGPVEVYGLGTLLGGEPPILANLLLLVGAVVLLCRSYFSAFILGSLGALLAITTWRYQVQLLLGYFLWQTSILAFAIGAWTMAWHRERENPKRGWAKAVLYTGLAFALLALATFMLAVKVLPKGYISLPNFG